MRIKLHLMSLLFAFCALFRIFAELPEDALVIDAWNMKSDGVSWVKTKRPGIFNDPTTKGFLLHGWAPQNESASEKLQCPEAGKYNIWVRYADQSPRYRKQHSFPFSLTAVQNGKKTAREFDAVSLKSDDAGLEKWGKNVAGFVWDKLSVELEAGPFELILSKPGKKENTRNYYARMIDCLVVTRDLKYEPTLTDFFPLYAKIEIPESEKKALSFTIHARTPRKIFWPHMSTRFIPNKGFRGGESTGWFELGSVLVPSDSENDFGNVLFCAYEGARTGKRRVIADSADYDIYISRKKSLDGLIRKASKRGRGSSMALRIPLKHCSPITTDTEESAENLKRSAAATPVNGKRPEKFIVSSGAEISHLGNETLKNETEALKNLGINRFNFSPSDAKRFAESGWKYSNVSFRAWGAFAKNTGCCLQTDVAAVEKIVTNAEKTAENFPEDIVVTRYASIADEPEYSHLGHVPNCRVCREGFPSFLKKNNVPLEEIRKDLPGCESLDSVLPSAGRKTPVLYYWTSRYGIGSVTEHLGKISAAAKKVSPEWRIGWNFAVGTHLNQAGAGMDRFGIARSGAMDYYMEEDYTGYIGVPEIRSYFMALARASCRKNHLEYYPLACYPGNSERNFTASGFAQIGQGARRLSLFNYGPHYLPASGDGMSRTPWVHSGTRRLTYTIGAVEDDLLKAGVERGDAALLCSLTNDIWADPSPFGNLYGMERIFLHVLLRRLQVRIDILSEEDIAGRLSDYMMLFATDSHIRREFVPVLRDWVRKGGRLYAGANALSRDEYDRPLGLLEELGIRRGAFEVKENPAPNRPLFEMRKHKAVRKVKTPVEFDACFGVQKLNGGRTLAVLEDGSSALSAYPCGGGTVYLSAVFPALSCVRDARIDKTAGGNVFSVYPDAQRLFLGQVVSDAGLRLRAISSDPMTEVNLLRNGKTLLAAISDWSGKEKKTSIVFSGFGKAEKISGVQTKISVEENTDSKIRISGTFGKGDIVTVKLL